MTALRVPVVTVGEVVKHSNADTLDVTVVFGASCIIKHDSFKPGDLAVYVPIDALVDTRRPEFLHMARGPGKADHVRLKAIRLRQQYSEGLLVPVPAGLKEGDDAAGALGVEKWEPPQQEGDNADLQLSDAQGPHTDFENHRFFSSVLDGKEVVVTEKLHGCNFRAVFLAGARFGEDRQGFHVGSHGRWKKQDGNLWATAANGAKIAQALAAMPNLTVYGEVFGPGVQDLHYGVVGTKALRVFDVWDIERQMYLGWDEVVEIAGKVGVETVPVLYRGLHDAKSVQELAEQPLSTLDGKTIREGVVVRSAVEDFFEEKTDVKAYRRRCVLKRISPHYLLRKDGTDLK